jgi:hypothetical protein
MQKRKMEAGYAVAGQPFTQGESSAFYENLGGGPQSKGDPSKAVAQFGPESSVTQICNLPYRRIAFGAAPRRQGGLEPATLGGLKIRDMADCKSALRLRAELSVGQKHSGGGIG